MKKEKQQDSQQQLNVESYEFETIKGFPMLNWKGKRPFTSTQYFPAQLKESYGKPDADGWMNKIFWGDNLQVMSHLLKEYRGKVQLVYIDPPFDSKADYKKEISIKGKSTTSESSLFEQKQYGDIWNNDDYLQYMYDRLILIRELLADDGSLYLHCDYHQSHYIRCILDEVFGKDRFINEIVWKRANTVKGNTGQGSKYFGENTDTIFFYSKSEKYIFNNQYKEYSQDYVDSFYKHIEEKTGRRYQLISMTGPGGEAKGNPKYEVMGVTRYWRYSKEKMNELIRKGLVVQTSTEAVPRKKIYLDEGLGVPVQTLWDDISALSSQDGERTGYPTQKPETLIERIIKTSSTEGGLVFDCFAGSGTTLSAAKKLNRKLIVADINLGSIRTMIKRLNVGGLNNSGFQLYNVNSYDVFNNPMEAKDILLTALEIEKVSNSIFDGVLDGRMVKIMPINRISSKADLNDLISGLDRKTFEKRKKENPNKAVEKILLVCMGHEPDLKAIFEKEVEYKLDIEIVDILRDKQDLQFKRESEAKIKIKKDKLIIEKFFPMNLLQKLSIQKEKVTDWKELVESVLIDWNYDGAVLEPQLIDIPEKSELVTGEYEVPKDAGTIRVKITDLLSESIEIEVVRE